MFHGVQNVKCAICRLRLVQNFYSRILVRKRPRARHDDYCQPICMQRDCCAIFLRERVRVSVRRAAQSHCKMCAGDADTQRTSAHRTRSNEINNKIMWFRTETDIWLINNQQRIAMELKQTQSSRAYGFLLIILDTENEQKKRTEQKHCPTLLTHCVTFLFHLEIIRVPPPPPSFAASSLTLSIKSN